MSSDSTSAMSTSTSAMSTTSTTTPDDMPASLPLALIFSFAIIGALFLLMLVLVVITVACCIAKRKRDFRENVDNHVICLREQYTHTVTNQSAEHRMQITVGNKEMSEDTKRHYYSQVNKIPSISKESVQDDEERSSSPPPLPPPPVFDTPSPHPVVKPQEIVAYNMDIPKTLIPYAPPPPVSGLASVENLNKVGTDQNPYDIPVDSLADYDEVDSFEGLSPVHTNRRKPSRAMSLQAYPSHYHHSPMQSDDDSSIYDTVEINEESPALVSSLQLSSSRASEGHYQSPKRRPKFSHSQSRGSYFDPTFVEALEPSMLQSSVSSFGSETPLPYGPIYDSPKYLRKTNQPQEISRHNIVEIQELGNGRFGRVMLAATANLSLMDLQLGSNTDKTRSFLVAVKTLKKDADASMKTTFQEEINFLAMLKHANVVRLLGVCSDVVSPFIIIEYMESGDLHQFLRKQKLVSDDTQHLEDGEATPLILLYMAVQISSGMRYLASRKFIHRDLATRNCLVGREFVIKISDFGMSQNLYESYYYRVQGQLILPIRWMAYESFYGKFSVKSDVWSFGVTVWEIYCMAECEPYSEMTNETMINDATKGHKRTLLRRPELCPQDVYDVMMRCWVHEPSMRADFEEIYSRLFLSYMTRSQEASY